VLDLLAAGRIRVSDLITHSFGIDRADEAFRLLEERTEPCLAIRLSYPPAADPDQAIRLRPAPAVLASGPASRDRPGVGWIGAGAFSAETLLPAFREAGFEHFVAVATASGVSARRAAERHGFEQAVAGADAVIGDPDVSVVVIATPHDAHEELATQALAAGRDVWCEKPLALTLTGVDEVEKAWRGSGRQLTLGFNRRWAPAVLAAQEVLARAQAPKLLVYRVAAGRVPDGHWYLDRRQGGRLIGEVCHFVDLAQALIGVGLDDEVAVLGGGVTPGDDGVAMALRFADGSVASITYGSTPPVAGKERIEVLTGSHQVIIDDFRSAVADGRILWKGRQDKGHSAHAAAFLRAVQGGPPMPTEAMLGTMRDTIAVAGRARAS
jgi:predicted dehydrogenase